MGEAKRRRDAWPHEARYWIAVNGASCALNVTPMQHPVITPTPEQALGFPTLEEAEHAQQVLLTAPIDDARAFLEALRPAVATGRVRAIQPAHPEPPTPGETVWVDRIGDEEERVYAPLLLFGPALEGTYRELGGVTRLEEVAELRGILSRHQQARLRHPTKTATTSTGVFLRTGRFERILTRTARTARDGQWITLMAFEREWLSVTGEPPPPRAEN